MKTTDLQQHVTDQIVATNRYPDGFEPLMVDGDGMLIYTLKLCYRKHVMMHDDVIGWDELSDTLGTTLAQVMGDDEFVKWKEGL